MAGEVPRQTVHLPLFSQSLLAAECLPPPPARRPTPQVNHSERSLHVHGREQMFCVGVSAGRRAALLSAPAASGWLPPPPAPSQLRAAPPRGFDSPVQRAPATGPFSHMSSFALTSLPCCCAGILGRITRPPGRWGGAGECSSFLALGSHATLCLVNESTAPTANEKILRIEADGLEMDH